VLAAAADLLPTGVDWRLARKVLLIAFLVRTTFAVLYYGSIDVTNSVIQAQTATERDPVYLPYLPAIANLLFFIGQVYDHTALPLGFPVKALSCLADSLLAAFFVVHTGLPRTRRERCAWMYALCPLSVMLVSFHGQWDALWLLPSVVALAVAGTVLASGHPRYGALLGVLGALAILFKPIPLALVPLLVSPIRRMRDLRSWSIQTAWVVGPLLSMLGVFLAIFAVQGFDLSEVLTGIRTYGGTSATVIVMGFPKRYLEIGLDIGTFRQLAILIAGLLLLRHHLRPERQGRMVTAAAICLVLQAVGGIAPQYMLWPLPFMLAAGRLRLSIVYTAVTTVFLVFYYLIPNASVAPGENLGIFIPLEGLRALAPPAELTRALDDPGDLETFRWIADWAMPTFMLALTAILVFGRDLGDRVLATGEDVVRRMRVAALWASPLAISVTVVAFLYVVWPHDDAGGRLAKQLPEDVTTYAAAPPSLIGATPPTYVPTADLGGSWWIGAPTVLWLGTAVWALYAMRRLRRADEADDERT